MSDDRQGNEEKGLLGRIAHVFSSEPRSRDDLHEILQVAAENTIIDEDEHSIISGAMEVSGMQARDIMVPRPQMVVIKGESSLEEILPQITRTKHSRYPVIGESPDDILGILLAKDLLPQILESDHENFDVRHLLRQSVVVPESKRLNVLLREFRENRNHMAIVIDEYGGVAGLVTIEDVLEEIVGEIEDETDATEDQFIRRISDDDFFIRALTPIDEFNEYFEVELSDEEFDTIGGVVMHAFGHMPARNEVTHIDGFEFKVINADQRKIHSLRLRPRRGMTADAGPAPPALSRALVGLSAPLAGALLTLSLAPFELWPAAIVGCGWLAYLLASCTPRQAFWRGWLFGLGLFGSGASWVYVSINVYGNASPPLAGFLTFAFCAGLALLHGLQAYLYARLVRPLPGGMLLGFPALWVLGEWLRSWLLTGFPWLYLGYAHVDTWLAGWAPITGVYGLSFTVAFTASCLFLAWRGRQTATLVSYGGILATLWGGGLLLKPIEWVATASREPLSVALYQPNIPLEKKWDRRYYRDILDQYETALRPHFAYDLVLWPESAIPRVFDRAGGFMDPVDRRAALSDTTLITGIPTRDSDGHYFNSIVALGQGDGQYHKQRLVPFGEYVPLENWLRGLIDFFDLPMSDFSAGSADQGPLRAGDYRVAPLICYEIVYPDLTARSARRAEILVTVSNDSWFGRSIGPLQHLEMARMRALENGRFLLRGTNNGVTAIIDHRGQIVARTAQFEEASLVGEAQVMLGNTPFTSFGSIPLLTALGLLLGSMALLYHTLWRDSEPAD